MENQQSNSSRHPTSQEITDESLKSNRNINASPSIVDQRVSRRSGPSSYIITDAVRSTLSHPSTDSSSQQETITNVPNSSDLQRRQEIAEARRMKKIQRAQILQEKQRRRLEQLQQQHGWSDVFSWKQFQESCSIHQHQQQSGKQPSHVDSELTDAVHDHKSNEQRQERHETLKPSESTTFQQQQDVCPELSSHHKPEDQHHVLRIAIVGCGGWFANRAHLPALATKLLQQSPRKKHRPTEKTPLAYSSSKYRITVLCGSHPERAIQTLARHGIKLRMTAAPNNNEFQQHQLQHVDDHVAYSFPTLDAYLSYEEEIPSCQEHNTLADVCLLCLPTPYMVQAIGRCLRANKYVISEKPASPSALASQSLWDAYCVTEHDEHKVGKGDNVYDTQGRRGRRRKWLVAENWAYKPSLRAFRFWLDTYRVLYGRPISYHMCIRQYCSDQNNTNDRPSTSWRQTASPQEQLRDLGVHMIRALRQLFGEVTRVCQCQHVAAESARMLTTLLKGTLLHEDENVALRGKLSLEMIRTQTTTRSEDAESSIAQLVVTFGNMSHNMKRTLLIWDLSKCCFYRLEEEITESVEGVAKGSLETPIATQVLQERAVVLEHVAGDHWITGGVAPLLEAALALFYQTEFGSDIAPRYIEDNVWLTSVDCGPEEALRDVAVMDAMLLQASASSASGFYKQHRNGFRYPPPADHNGCNVSGFRPTCVLPNNRIPLQLSNSTGTFHYSPLHLSWCASIQDVVDVVMQARKHQLKVQPIGTLHSYSLIQDVESCWISLALWNRISDFRVEQRYEAASKTALVRVGVGMTLHSLCSRLKTAGFILPSLPVLLHQSIGGAIATGSHGSSAHQGTVSDCVVAVRLVDHNGNVKTIIPEDSALTPELQSLVQDDTNEVVASDIDLREARCGLGAVGVVVDVVLRVVPIRPVVKSEVSLDMECERISETIIGLALSSDHFWVHWRLSKDSAGVAAAILLRHDAPYDSQGSCTSTQSQYNGRSWYPHGSLIASVLDAPRKVVSEERKYTMQCSFRSGALHDVIAIMKQQGAHFASKVVELKFIKGSTLTNNAPNSTSEKDGDCFVALNAWWDLESPELLAALEASMRQVPGMILHKGKYCSSLNSSSRKASTFIDSSQLDPILSVILPVYNAMPWLPTAVHDVLNQDIEGESIEVLAADDASKDESLSFLVEVAIGLGERGSVEVVSSNGYDSHCLTPLEARKWRFNGGSKSLNPALLMPSREADISTARVDEVKNEFNELSIATVVAGTAKRNRLRVLVSEQLINCGQGAAMTRCLRFSRAPYIGHMESDDARPVGAFQKMLDSLRRHPEWDGVASQTKCIGWDASGMKRYVEWQNDQDTPDKMRKCRFVEMPALLQASAFRRWAVDLALAVDNETGECSYRDDAMWPVDYHFWLSFFDTGLHVGKIPESLFFWRQHPGQQTRNHGRLSISNLRKCKCIFLCRDRGPIWTAFQKGKPGEILVVEVWSTSNTLVGWVEDLAAELLQTELQESVKVFGVDWKPGQSRPRCDRIRSGTELLRLFAFGMEKTRKQVRNEFGEEWDDNRFIFVA